MNTRELLERFVDELEIHNISIRRHLQIGLSKKDIVDLLSSKGLSAPEGIVDLFSWKNGLDEECDSGFFDEHYFIPLDTCLVEYEYYKEVYESQKDLYDFDIFKLFPFADFMGSYYMMYCGDDLVGEIRNPIFRVYQGIDKAFVSLQSMLYTQIEWYSSGAYNQRTLNEQLKKQIWRELNRGIKID